MSRQIRKVLVIKLSALGDFVLALAAMRRIREAHPKARITLLTTPPFEALARACPYFDEVETDGKPEGPGAWLALRGRLKGILHRSSRADTGGAIAGRGQRNHLAVARRLPEGGIAVAQADAAGQGLQ